MNRVRVCIKPCNDEIATRKQLKHRRPMNLRMKRKEKKAGMAGRGKIQKENVTTLQKETARDPA